MHAVIHLYHVYYEQRKVTYICSPLYTSPGDTSLAFYSLGLEDRFSPQLLSPCPSPH